MYIYRCVYTYIYIQVSIYIFSYIYIYTHTHRLPLDVGAEEKFDAHAFQNTFDPFNY